MTSYKNSPPDLTTLNDAINYDRWRTKWTFGGEKQLAKEKRALAVTLSLSGKYREVATAVPVEHLDTADGRQIC